MQAIGTPDIIDPDFYEVALDVDALQLGSDGLTVEVDVDDTENIVTGTPDLESAGER